MEGIQMKRLILLLLMLMFILSACKTTQGTTTKDFDKVFEDSPVDLSGR